MELLNETLIASLEKVNEDTCLSLYMTTHRSHPDNLQDPIEFKNLIKILEDSLLQKYSSKEVTEYLLPFEQLLINADVWNHASDGLAVFSSGSFFKMVALPVTFQSFSLVSDHFYTKPLLKYLQSVDRYQVLGISLHDMQLFEGNRHTLMEIDLPDNFPETIKEALGEDLTEKHLTVNAHGGVGGESSNLYHGQGGKKDEVDIDTERFFRKVALEVHENYSKPSGLPLILASLTEHHNIFQSVSNNPFLLPKGIQHNYKAITIAKLTEAAWELMEPVYLSKLEGFAEKYGEAAAKKLGSHEPHEIAKAAAEGRVELLLLEEDRQIGGKIVDMTIGAIELAAIDDPEVGDLLYEIGRLVNRMGGKVVVIPKDKMPVDTGLASIYRY